MSPDAWRRLRNDRSLRYAERVLDPTKRIAVQAQEPYIRTYQGQVAALTVTNLLGRMSPNIVLDIPRTPMVDPLPWSGVDVGEHCIELLRQCDPFATPSRGSAVSADYLITLGCESQGPNVHSSGWQAYYGNGSSPLRSSDEPNPIGAAFAAILAVADLFQNDFSAPACSQCFDTLSWSNSETQERVSLEMPSAELGEIWSIGLGATGSATLFFLTLYTRSFESSLVDHDTAGIENLDRSPIYFASDVGRLKVSAAADYLRGIGVRVPAVEGKALHESKMFKERRVGSPDIMVTAANEYNVRNIVENSYPPLQIYGTTGDCWQAAFVRHRPIAEACSCCLFGEPEAYAPTRCATGKVASPNQAKKIDAALPFLSFAAGLMAAAEILKSKMVGFPFTANRVILNTYDQARLVHLEIPRQRGCLCQGRSASLHRRAILGTSATILRS